MMKWTSIKSCMLMITFSNIQVYATDDKCYQIIKTSSPSNAKKQCHGELRLANIPTDSDSLIQKNVNSLRLWNGYLLKTPYLVNKGCYNLTGHTSRFDTTQKNMNIPKCWNICYSKHKNYSIAINRNKCLCVADKDIVSSQFSSYQHGSCSQDNDYRFFVKSEFKGNSTISCLQYNLNPIPKRCGTKVKVVCMTQKNTDLALTSNTSWSKGMEECSKNHSTLMVYTTAFPSKGNWTNDIWLNDRRYASSFTDEDIKGFIATGNCHFIILNNSKIESREYRKCNTTAHYICETDCTTTTSQTTSIEWTVTFPIFSTTNSGVPEPTPKVLSSRRENESGSNTGTVIGGAVAVVCVLLCIGIVIGVLIYRKRNLPKDTKATQDKSLNINAIENIGYGAQNLDIRQDQGHNFQAHEYSTIYEDTIKNEDASGSLHVYQSLKYQPTQNATHFPKNHLLAQEPERSSSVYHIVENTESNVNTSVGDMLQGTNSKECDQHVLYHTLETVNTASGDIVGARNKLATLPQPLKDSTTPFEENRAVQPSTNEHMNGSGYELASLPQTLTPSEQSESFQFYHVLEKQKEKTEGEEGEEYSHLEHIRAKDNVTHYNARDSTYAHAGQDIIDDGTYAHTEHMKSMRYASNENDMDDPYASQGSGKDF